MGSAVAIGRVARMVGSRPAWAKIGMQAIGVPNVADRTVYASNRRKIITALLIAFVIRAIARMEKGRKNQNATKVIGGIVATNIPAWIVLVAILSIASDFDSTSELAVAFALLVLVAVLLNDGLKTASILQSWVPSEPTKPKPKKGT